MNFSREKLDLLIKKIADILKDEIMKSGIRRKEGETELRILVQSSQAGAIIGTKGTTVKTLREVRTPTPTQKTFRSIISTTCANLIITYFQDFE